MFLHSVRLFTLSVLLLGLVSCEISKKDNIAEDKSNGLSSEKLPKESDTTRLSLPDIKGVGHNGDSIFLKSVKAKYILLEFWASWCPPCRQFNPSLVKVYEKYRSQGFEIFSISLDHDAKKWKTAIAKDNLYWPYHTSDFKGWDSPWATQFHIESIPNNILFDSEGNVLAREMEPEQLDKTLSSLLLKK